MAQNSLPGRESGVRETQLYAEQYENSAYYRPDDTGDQKLPGNHFMILAKYIFGPERLFMPVMPVPIMICFNGCRPAWCNSSLLAMIAYLRLPVEIIAYLKGRLLWQLFRGIP